MKLRVSELEGIADLGEWSATVIFVAHRLSVAAYDSREIEGVTISFQFMSFEELVNSTDLAAPNWAAYLLAPMRERRTPSEARLALRVLSGVMGEG